MKKQLRLNLKLTTHTHTYIYIYSKKCWVVLTQFWVKYGQTQPLGYIFKLHF